LGGSGGWGGSGGPTGSAPASPAGSSKIGAPASGSSATGALEPLPALEPGKDTPPTGLFLPLDPAAGTAGRDGGCSGALEPTSDEGSGLGASLPIGEELAGP
jgi:hypothetical protein